jgi:hypothetical protein
MVTTLGYRDPSNGEQRFIMVRPSLKTDGYEVLQWGSEKSANTGRYDYAWPYKTPEAAYKSATGTAKFLRECGWEAL